MRALLISANVDERDFLSFALRRMGVKVTAVANPSTIWSGTHSQPFNIIILCAQRDESTTLVQEIRHQSHVAIFLIVDPVTEQAHCQYLDAGVDRILERPISMPLFSRYAQKMLQRSSAIPATILTAIEAEDIRLDPGTRTVYVTDHEPRLLTQLEFRLLYVLMTNAGQVVPTDELVERVWGYSGDGNRDLVRGLIRRLRRKIEPKSDKPSFIHNLPGVGYRFSAEAKP